MGRAALRRAVDERTGSPRAPRRRLDAEVPSVAEEDVELLDEQAATDPYCPIFDWIGPAPPLKPRRYR